MIIGEKRLREVKASRSEYKEIAPQKIVNYKSIDVWISRDRIYDSINNNKGIRLEI